VRFITINDYGGRVEHTVRLGSTGAERAAPAMGLRIPPPPPCGELKECQCDRKQIDIVDPPGDLPAGCWRGLPRMGAGCAGQSRRTGADGAERCGQCACTRVGPVQLQLPLRPGQAGRPGLLHQWQPDGGWHYRVDVYVNGGWQGRRDLQFKADEQGRVDACLPLPMLEEMGVDSEAVLLQQDPTLPTDTTSCVPVQRRMANAYGIYDSGNLRYDLSIPQVFLRREARGYVNPSLWDRGINAGFVGYSFNAIDSDSRVEGAAQSQRLPRPQRRPEPGRLAVPPRFQPDLVRRQRPPLAEHCHLCAARHPAGARHAHHW
jgi:hypothetical protein